jgi:hypothetical protein
LFPLFVIVIALEVWVGLQLKMIKTIYIYLLYTQTSTPVKKFDFLHPSCVKTQNWTSSSHRSTYKKKGLPKSISEKKKGFSLKKVQN